VNLFEYPNERGAECVDWGPDGLYILILHLCYITLRGGTIHWQGAAGLVGRCCEGDSLKAPVWEQYVVGTTTLTVSFPEGPVEVSTIAVSKLRRRVLLLKQLQHIMIWKMNCYHSEIKKCFGV
jgi:hypothetical protein